MEIWVAVLITSLLSIITYFIGNYRGVLIGYEYGHREGIKTLANEMGIPVSALYGEDEEEVKTEKPVLTLHKGDDDDKKK